VAGIRGVREIFNAARPASLAPFNPPGRNNRREDRAGARGGVEFVKQGAESAQRCRELASQGLAPAAPVG